MLLSLRVCTSPLSPSLDMPVVFVYKRVLTRDMWHLVNVRRHMRAVSRQERSEVNREGKSIWFQVGFEPQDHITTLKIRMFQSVSALVYFCSVP